MAISVADKKKCLLARKGPNKLFGDDIDERQALGELAAIKLFDEVWQRKLERLVSTANISDSEEAYARLTQNKQQFFNFEQEHRDFRAKELNAEFIVQLAEKGGDDYELTQLWRVSSSDTHPKTLFVSFETVEEREQFRQIAANLGIHDQQLGLQLCKDFMEKFPERFREDKV